MSPACSARGITPRTPRCTGSSRRTSSGSQPWMRAWVARSRGNSSAPTSRRPRRGTSSRRARLDRHLLLEVFLIDRGVTEIAGELAHRPEMTVVPIRALLELAAPRRAGRCAGSAGRRSSRARRGRAPSRRSPKRSWREPPKKRRVPDSARGARPARVFALFPLDPGGKAWASSTPPSYRKDPFP